MKSLLDIWRRHGTKILGLGSGIISSLAGTGVIPESHLKYYLAVGAVLTALRGFQNSIINGSQEGAK